ncbi:DsbE family thiol:disulfide interchange protein [Vibrio hannami]|uniref:DsbE family thiol:disulfide interchange protein n=1 Tax=Vibrio hannami TaxID=2717094 RepID=UPI0024109E2E|nr:DsbE family thiol:disulfide interchange protein [Vibrio hannami]MDG3088222.1 DsbE family thiol:disulfide interchange protein [Vibrio hannami]
MSEVKNKSGSKAKVIGFVAIIVAVFGAFLYALEGGTESTNQTMVGEPVPEFSLQSLHDETQLLNNSSIPSNKYSLINVWAEWCAACKSEHGYLMALKNRGVDIIGLNYRDDRKAALKMIDELGNPYKHILFDHRGTLALDLGVIGAPETFLISPEGKILTRFSGVIDQNIWQQKFEPYIEEEM